MKNAPTERKDVWGRRSERAYLGVSLGFAAFVLGQVLKTSWLMWLGQGVVFVGLVVTWFLYRQARKDKVLP